MTTAGVQKTVTPVVGAGVAVVTSDAPTGNTSRPSTGAGVTSEARRGAVYPLSKREREREGELKPSPLLSPSTLPKPQPKQAATTPTLAAYAGAVSRFCDLHGLTPDASRGDKAALEFEAFNQYLADRAAERRRVAELNF